MGIKLILFIQQSTRRDFFVFEEPTIIYRSEIFIQYIVLTIVHFQLSPLIRFNFLYRTILWKEENSSENGAKQKQQT